MVPAPTRSHRRRGDADRPREALELSRQGDVLHQRQIGKAADGAKRHAADKNCLIAGRDAGEPRAPIDHSRDQRKQRMTAGNTQVETAPSAVRSAARKCSGNEAIGIVRQRCIGMKKDQDIAAAERRAEVHRGAAVARAHNHPIRQGSRQRHGAVTAAAVHHDHFGAAGAQRRQCSQCAGDNRRLLKHRNDDAQPPGRRMHAPPTLPAKPQSGNLAEHVKQTG